MAGVNPTAGSGLNSVPAPGKQTLASAFVDLRDSGWAQQYLPDLMEKEAEVFGNRTISGFLAQVGAEEAMAADQVVWSEQGRLHIKESVTITTASTGLCTTAAAHSIRVGDTIVLHGLTGTGDGATVKCYVSAVPSTTTFNALPYTQAALSTGSLFADADTATVFVYGSEFKKGQTGRAEALEPGFQSFENKPVIIKDLYEVSGSDASAIGWIEVSGEEGQSGYLWYLKASGDTMSRFADYCEMVCIEGELATGSGVQGQLGTIAGTEGLFAAVKNRGHYTTGIVGTSASDDLDSFDYILKKFDAQGAIEENMMFVNRDVSLAIDDMLAAQNSYGANGTSFGVFDNSEEMALNLGFSGFRRGSYDFYKSDWKYLNDANTRGALAGEDVRGVFVPAGVSSVYDQMLGKNMKRPFLHVRYRASQTESRRMKTWITGSVGAATSDLDAMEVNYLSERCLITQGANNFMLLTD
jgi:hypothetical protein